MSQKKRVVFEKILRKIRLFFSLPTGWVSVLLTVIAVGLLFSAFLLNNNGKLWLSNAFVSFACSLITGVVLFALTNFRINKSIEIKTEYERMKAVYEFIQSKKRDASFYLRYPKLYNDNKEKIDFILQMGESLQDIEDIVTELPERVFFNILDYENTYPVSFATVHQIEELYHSIDVICDESKTKELCNALLPIFDSLISWLQPAKKDIDDRYKELSRQIL